MFRSFCPPLTGLVLEKLELWNHSGHTVCYLIHPWWKELGQRSALAFLVSGPQILRSYFFLSFRLVFSYSTQYDVISRRLRSGYFFMITTKS